MQRPENPGQSLCANAEVVATSLSSLATEVAEAGPTAASYDSLRFGLLRSSASVLTGSSPVASQPSRIGGSEDRRIGAPESARADLGLCTLRPPDSLISGPGHSAFLEQVDLDGFSTNVVLPRHRHAVDCCQLGACRGPYLERDFRLAGLRYGRQLGSGADADRRRRPAVRHRHGRQPDPGQRGEPVLRHAV